MLRYSRASIGAVALTGSNCYIGYSKCYMLRLTVTVSSDSRKGIAFSCVWLFARRLADARPPPRSGAAQ